MSVNVMSSNFAMERTWPFPSGVRRTRRRRYIASRSATQAKHAWSTISRSVQL
jgi:hypothetical protein